MLILKHKLFKILVYEHSYICICDVCTYRYALKLSIKVGASEASSDADTRVSERFYSGVVAPTLSYTKKQLL